MAIDQKPGPTPNPQFGPKEASDAKGAPRVGRRRDDSIDARILTAARRQLACKGYEAMSLASVAEEACTTRQALYRRWQDKAALAAHAVGPQTQLQMLCVSDDPRADLERELAEFEQFMRAPEQRSLAGTMLQDGTDAKSRAEYGRTVIGPRLQRIRVILEHARQLGLLDESADIEVALTLPTGALYEQTLAGLPIPTDWSTRTTSLIWRALGGQPGSMTQSQPSNVARRGSTREDARSAMVGWEPRRAGRSRTS